jgi:ribosomal protein S18 acetylase RimI-like enzyme
MDDVDRVVTMLNARSQKLYGENQSTRESVTAWWEKPGFTLKTDMRLVLDEDGAVAGLAYVDNDGAPYASLGCIAAVAPRYESDTTLWDGLYAWGLERASELVPLASDEIRVAATASAARQDDARRAALDRAGFTPVRGESHMRIDLVTPPAGALWPAGVSVRTTDLDADLSAIVAAYLEAWRDHWGFVARPFADVLAGFLGEIENRCGPIDPTLWFLAVEGREVVGMSLCIPGLMDDPTGGYIYDLGVRPAWRRRGIALALLHHTFAEFHRRGYAAVELDVDSQSLTGALRVYERAGMRVVRQTVTYEQELRPGIDLATRALTA